MPAPYRYAVLRLVPRVEREEFINAGDLSAGPIALLNHRERFHWLTAPRSTMLQTAAVKTGLADDLDATLEHLARELCL